MLLAGDEIGQTQRGNNNTYCQDNELTWLAWEHADQDFLAFAKKVTRLLTAEPVLRRRTFFLGRPIHGEGVADVSWFKPNGHELVDGEWKTAHKCFGMRLAGDQISETDEYGEPIIGNTLLVLFNAGQKAVRFTLPATKPEHVWELLFDTADDHKPPARFPGGARYDMADHSLVVFRTRTV